MMPKKGERLHSFNCPDPVWEPAAIRAAAEGATLTDVLVAALTAYGASEVCPVCRGSRAGDDGGLCPMCQGAGFRPLDPEGDDAWGGDEDDNVSHHGSAVPLGAAR